MRAFLTIVSVQSPHFIVFDHSCHCFFVWLWQQVYDNIYNLRLYYADSGTQQDYILSSLCNLAESVLVWMGHIQFDLCFASSAVM